MRQIILLLFLASILLSAPCSLADYDKNSISSAESSGLSTANSAAGQPSTGSSKRSTTKLYGRIEEIIQSPGAQFPVVLKAQTAKMDTSNLAKLQQHGEASFSGKKVRSFPEQFTGTWGG